jgi:hypothetical protein
MTTKITEQNISQLANAGTNWQPVVTADGSTGLTVVAGRGYFIDTTSAAQTITLPASPKVGDVIALKDYARTWNSNAITISSALFDGVTKTNVFNTQGQTIRLVYTGNTKGWSLENEDTVTALNAQFTSATGGTVTTSGDYKIHSFTGDGCFVVTAVGNVSTVPTGGPDTISYLVVAGGGGSGPAHWSGGGGAGGFREGRDITPSYTASPLVAPAGLTITATTYPVTVGAGGGDGNGSNSVVSTITSAGGGYGGNPGAYDTDGGSGGGGNPYYDASVTQPGSSGNTPPVSPPQGNPGGFGYKWECGFAAASGGGGGAGGTGGNSLPYPGPPAAAGIGGAGGNGATTNITGSPVTYAGGGGGSTYTAGRGGAGGPGGGGNGGVYNPAGPLSQPPLVSTSGAANTGGGGGGDYDFVGPAGGSGIVILRYKYQ